MWYDMIWLDDPRANLASYDVVETILGQGCNVNLLNKEGISALTFAVINNEKEIVKLLLDNGADTEIKGKGIEYGKTPLLYACTMGHIEIVQLLIEIGQCNIYAKVTGNDTSALILCVGNDNIELVSYLIECHEQYYHSLNMYQFVNETNINGVTPLMVAASKGNYDMCNMLIYKYKADPSIQNVV